MSNEQALVPIRSVEETESISGILTLDNQPFASVKSAVDYIQSLPAQKRYDAQLEIKDQLENTHDIVQESVDEFLEYVLEAQEWKASNRIFDKTDWEKTKNISEQAKATRDKGQEARKSIGQKWGQQFVDKYLSEKISSSLLREIRRVAMNMDSPEEALQLANRNMLDRLKSSAQGRRRTMNLVPTDFKHIVDLKMTLENTSPVTAEEAQEESLYIDHLGLLMEASENSRTVQTVPPSPRLVATTAAPAPFGYGRLGEVATGDDNHPGGEVLTSAQGEDKGKGKAAVPGQSSGEKRSLTQSNIQPGEPESSGQEIGGDVMFRGPGPSNMTSSTVTEKAEEEPPTRKRRLREIEQPQYDENAESSDSSLDGDETGEYDESTEKATQGQNLKCKCNGMPKGLLKRLNAGAKPSMGAIRTMLDDMAQALAKNGTLCYFHAHRLGGKLELTLQKVNHEGLMEWLSHIHANFEELGRLKTADDTYHWFRRSARPVRPEDELGPYRFKHQTLPAFDFDPEAILEGYGLQGYFAEFQRRGTVSIPIFDWWKSSGILDLIRDELNMYRYHMRLLNGRNNMGWLRNCLYSLGQQLMRQDPMYWIVYCCLRHDKKTEVVSYPYYCKFQQEGDRTAFRHIDFSLKAAYESGRGLNMIQGSLSLDDEAAPNCTVLVPEMHKHLHEWYDRINARKETATTEKGQKATMEAQVNRVLANDLTAEDLQHFGVDWEDVPCKAGEVRISMPHLPHGSHGPATATRRTFLPWYIGIQDDHEQLEVNEAGTYSMISAAHREQTAPSASPSGFPNRYGAIPYAFPAGTQLTGLGEISDALVGRIKWTDPNVQMVRTILLGGNMERSREYIQWWRQLAAKKIRTCLETMERAERAAFQDKSFYKRREQGESIASAVDHDPLGDAETLSEEERLARTAEDIEFAEAEVPELEDDAGEQQGVEIEGRDVALRVARSCFSY